MVLHPPTASNPLRKLGSTCIRTFHIYWTSNSFYHHHQSRKTKPTNTHCPEQFLLGLCTIIPWAALILFDAAFYLYRLILWELPFIGGRARGQQRPRAPSLNERPDGQRRAFGLRGVETDSADGEDEGDEDRGGSRGATTNGVDEGSGSEKENVAPALDGWAHSSGPDGGVKLRVGRA